MSARIVSLLKAGSEPEVWRYAEDCVDRLAGPLHRDVVMLLDLCVLAAQYGHEDLALSWIDRYEEKSRDAAGSCNAVRLAVELAVKANFQAASRGRAFDWSAAPGSPWVLNLRMLVALRDNDFQALLAVLRRPLADGTRPPQYVRPYDLGNRLRILGWHFFSRGLWDRCLGCFRAALKYFARDEGVDARLKEIELLGSSGIAAYHGGRLAAAEDLLTKAVEKADSFRHFFYRNKFQLALAGIWSDREEYARAEELLRRVAREAKGRSVNSGLDHSLCVTALISAASTTIDAGEPSRAAALLAEARRLLEVRDHPRYRGYLHVAQGRVEALRGDKNAVARARRQFDLAEEHFDSIGEGDLIGLATVSLHRGRLFLKERDIRSALAQAVRCAEAARASRSQPLQAASLLLKSQLLVEQETLEPEGLYEEVLSNLGMIHSDVWLFKAIANLYVFSWDLKSQVDLTDLHLEQLNRLTAALDRQTFLRLYKKHVVHKLSGRLKRTLDFDLEEWLRSHESLPPKTT